MKWQTGDYARIKQGNGLYSGQPCVVVDSPSALWPGNQHVDVYVLSGGHRGKTTSAHEDNLALIVPPTFTSPAEADAWLDANAR